MQIVNRKLDELIPYAKNSRTHSKAQVAQLVRSLQEFGWTNPVLLDGEAGIIAGHGRVMAAKRICADGGAIPRWPDVSVVPTIELAGLTKEQARAYVIADNQLALNAGWDEDALASELRDLQIAGLDLSLLSFDDAALASMLGGGIAEGLTDPDDAPEATTLAVSRLGDLWILGGHRILCGDSTTPEHSERLLAGVKPHLMVTDPPYGVEYDANWRNEADRANGKPYGARAVGQVENDDRADWRGAWALFPGDVAYVWCASMFSDVVVQSLEAAGFERRSQIIWGKPRFAISRGHYHWQHEPCWYAVRKGKQGHWGGARDQSTLWSIAHIKSETGHSTQKPVECMRRPIENNSSVGQAVYEPFSGSGTTIIAAEQTGRVCYAMELSPNYVDVAVRRWQAFTGKVATLEGDGRSFAEIEAERLPRAAAA